MSEFEDILHHVATIGEHVIEYVEGHTEIRLNGQAVAPGDIEHLVKALTEAAGAVGLVLNLAG